VKRHYWTAAEIRKLRRLYPNMENGQLGERLGRSWSAVQNMAVKLQLKKSVAFLNSPACRFQKGAVPWNRGVTGYMGANRTSFRKGNKPQTWRPVGYLPRREHAAQHVPPLPERDSEADSTTRRT
jgi:hypothetical protein